jgi:transposase-like protein
LKHTASSPYRRHRFTLKSSAIECGFTSASPESYRDVKEVMRVRGVIVTYEVIREWFLKFGIRPV